MLQVITFLADPSLNPISVGAPNKIQEIVYEEPNLE